jgi:flagella basal body P-ring formation protein FlgA
LAWYASISITAAQEIPAWRKSRTPTLDDQFASIRIALKPTAACFLNIVTLGDIADLSGSESWIQAVRDLPLGPAPTLGGRQTWSQDDVLNILRLRGFDERGIRWGGEDACQVIRREPNVSVPSTMEAVSFEVTPSQVTMAERTVSNVVLNYLQSKSSDASSWTIKPVIPNEYAKVLTLRKSIKSISGGREPWTGEQEFELLLDTTQGEKHLRLPVEIRTPTLVIGASGPLAKGHLIHEDDLKLVRLTSSMKASPENCFHDAIDLVGQELRRAISTGQPISRTDIGPPRIVQAKDLVEIQVVAGSVVAKTAGRAMQSGGIGEVIEVEIVGVKKRLAARVIGENTVEAIAR